MASRHPILVATDPFPESPIHGSIHQYKKLCYSVLGHIPSRLRADQYLEGALGRPENVLCNTS